MTAIASGNLLAEVPDKLDAEQTRSLGGDRRTRIERIVSTGQASPPGFWYDQDHAELVVVMAGAALVRIAGESAPRRLEAGDWIDIPAHCRHRVEWTDPASPTIWLAIHYGTQA